MNIDSMLIMLESLFQLAKFRMYSSVLVQNDNITSVIAMLLITIIELVSRIFVSH